MINKVISFVSIEWKLIKFIRVGLRHLEMINESGKLKKNILQSRNGKKKKKKHLKSIFLIFIVSSMLYIVTIFH